MDFRRRFQTEGPSPASREADRAPRQGEHKRTIVIEATATVVARSKLDKSAGERARATQQLRAAETATAPLRQETKRAEFGRRARTTLVAERRRQNRDILSQAFAFRHPGDDEPRSEGTERAAAGGSAAAGMSVRKAAMMTAGFAVGLLSIPVLVLSLPQSPIAATVLAADPTLALGDVTASITPHGTGAVLKVEAAVTNGGGEAVLVPPLEVTVRDTSGDLQARPLGTSLGILRSGTTLHISSAQAVAATTSGEVGVRFRDDAYPTLATDLSGLR